METYSIIWSPEGRKLAEFAADNGREALQTFKRKAKSLGLSTYARHMGELYAQSTRDRLRVVMGVTIEQTVDGEYMILREGVQWGGTVDKSGAGDLTFPTIYEAYAAAISEWKP